MLNETPPDKLEAALAPILDIDGALKFLALEVALVNSDGYWTRASDYSIYQDEKGIFHVIPHDVNEGTGRRGRRRTARRRSAGGFGGRWSRRPWPRRRPADPGGLRRVRRAARRPRRVRPGGAVPISIRSSASTTTSKPLRSKLLAVPALRAAYLSYVREIADKWLDWKTLGPLAQKYHALIAADVKADTRKLFDNEGSSRAWRA